MSSVFKYSVFSFMYTRLALLHQKHQSGPGVIKLFPCSTQLSTKFILLINVKMPTFISMINTTSAERLYKQETSSFVGIVVFMSSWNFVLSWVEHEKSFITPRPSLQQMTTSHLIITHFQEKIRQWFRCCWFIVYCCFHCLLDFVFDPFVMQYFF